MNSLNDQNFIIDVDYFFYMMNVEGHIIFVIFEKNGRGVRIDIDCQFESTQGQEERKEER